MARTAVFHFLVGQHDRRRHRELMARTVPAGGFVIMATFALDGPERCSGLDVRRYDTTLLSGELGDEYDGSCGSSEKLTEALRDHKRS